MLFWCYQPSSWYRNDVSALARHISFFAWAKRDRKVCACGYLKIKGLLSPGYAGREAQTGADGWGGEGASDLLSEARRNKKEYYSAHCANETQLTARGKRLVSTYCKSITCKYNKYCCLIWDGDIWRINSVHSYGSKFSVSYGSSCRK